MDYNGIIKLTRMAAYLSDCGYHVDIDIDAGKLYVDGDYDAVAIDIGLTFGYEEEWLISPDYSAGDDATILYLMI